MRLTDLKTTTVTTSGSSQLGRYDARKRETLRNILQELQQHFEGLRFTELRRMTKLSTQALSDGINECVSKKWIERGEDKRCRITTDGREAVREFYTSDTNFSTTSIEELMGAPISSQYTIGLVSTPKNLYASASVEVLIVSEMLTKEQREKFDKWCVEWYLPRRCILLDSCPLQFSKLVEISAVRRLTHCPTCDATLEPTSRGPMCPNRDFSP